MVNGRFHQGLSMCKQLCFREFNDQTIRTNTGEYRIETRGNKSMLSINQPKQGIYKVRATNVAGAATSYAYLTVIGRYILQKV
jgi:hypothetical protein